MSGEGTEAESVQLRAVSGTASQGVYSGKEEYSAGADMGGPIFGYGNCDMTSMGSGVAGGEAMLIGMGWVVGKNWVDGCADRQYPSAGDVGSR